MKRPDSQDQKYWGQNDKFFSQRFIEDIDNYIDHLESQLEKVMEVSKRDRQLLIEKDTVIGSLESLVSTYESQLEKEREDYFSIIEHLIEHEQYVPKYHEDNYTLLKLKPQAKEDEKTNNK